MANAERNKNAPQLSTSSRLNHAEHVADAIRPFATRAVTEASHTVKAIELFGGQAVEIAEVTNHAALNELREQLLADALKVERPTANRISQRLEVLRRAGTVRTAMAHLVTHHFSAA
jgi:hypothetical protein